MTQSISSQITSAATAPGGPAYPGAIVARVWRDRAGRFSPLRLSAFLLATAPALWLAWLLASGAAGARPAEAALDLTGEWSVRFLLLSLAVTPFRRIFNWSALIKIRRLLGLAAASYAALHLGVYLVDLGGDLAKAASEISQRFYLTIGFVALAGLALLSVTSTDRWIRRLGAGWRRLHWAVYPIAALALWHYLLQSKADGAEATLMVGAFALLMAYRLPPAFGAALTPVRLAVIALASAPAMMGFEALWYQWATTIPVDRVWAANFDVVALWYGEPPRPGWLTGLIGLTIAAAAALRANVARRKQATRATPLAVQ